MTRGDVRHVCVPSCMEPARNGHHSQSRPRPPRRLRCPSWPPRSPIRTRCRATSSRRLWPRWSATPTTPVSAPGRCSTATAPRCRCTTSWPATVSPRCCWPTCGSSPRRPTPTPGSPRSSPRSAAPTSRTSSTSSGCCGRSSASCTRSTSQSWNEQVSADPSRPALRVQRRWHRVLHRRAAPAGVPRRSPHADTHAGVQPARAVRGAAGLRPLPPHA